MCPAAGIRRGDGRRAGRRLRRCGCERPQRRVRLGGHGSRAGGRRRADRPSRRARPVPSDRRRPRRDARGRRRARRRRRHRADGQPMARGRRRGGRPAGGRRRPPGCRRRLPPGGGARPGPDARPLRTRRPLPARLPDRPGPVRARPRRRRCGRRGVHPRALARRGDRAGGGRLACPDARGRRQRPRRRRRLRRPRPPARARAGGHRLPGARPDARHRAVARHGDRASDPLGPRVCVRPADGGRAARDRRLPLRRPRR